jgi:hypothetical protein
MLLRVFVCHSVCSEPVSWSLLACMHQEKLEAAIEAYRLAVQLWRSQQPVVFYSLANALGSLGRTSEAQAAIDEALSTLAPNAPFRVTLENLREKLAGGADKKDN